MIALLTNNKALAAYWGSLLEEAGIPLTLDHERAKLLVVDLDTQKCPEGADNAVTVSSDPFVLCDLMRPFLGSRFLSLCCERLSLAPPTASLMAEWEEKPQEATPDFVIDESGVAFCGERVMLTGAEYRLFMLLFQNRGQAVSIKACADAIGNVDHKSNAPSVYINHLRRKLDYRFQKRLILTVRQKGYMLVSE